MSVSRNFYNLRIAHEAIMANKLKSLLTALGIIFGVAAVISMFAIGNGARQEILDQIKKVGLNNIVVEALIPENESSEASSGTNGDEKQENPVKFSRGLTLLDAEAFRTIPTTVLVSPVISLRHEVIFDSRHVPATVEGVANPHFSLFNLKVETGSLFSPIQEEAGLPVCVLGKDLARKLFGYHDPLGKQVKCGTEWLRVIGVLEGTTLEPSPEEKPSIDSPPGEDQIFIPLQTVLLRYRNRAYINSKVGKKEESEQEQQTDTESEKEKKNYHQVDRIVVQVKEARFLQSTAEILDRMIKRRHSGVTDYTITVPELLLKQQQRTKDIFNLVLGAIASISLIVGGIGIMNIMLASVLERIREIGTRRAIGATRRDIVIQFLAESVLISASGGILGIGLGVGLARLITHFSGILTIVSPFSIVIAFGVSVSVGILFGIVPARQAAEKDPVEAIRYE